MGGWCAHVLVPPQTTKWAAPREPKREFVNAVAHPNETADIQLKFVKALNPEVIAEEVNILKRVAITPDVEKNGFGVVSSEKMQSTFDFINKDVDV